MKSVGNVTTEGGRMNIEVTKTVTFTLNHVPQTAEPICGGRHFVCVVGVKYRISVYEIAQENVIPCL